MKKRYSKKEKRLARRILKWVNSKTMEIAKTDIHEAWKLDFLISWDWPTELCRKVAARPL